jgi:H+/Na+-translocating ferredoxin:NAD+ oxidoreductase subunit B
MDIYEKLREKIDQSIPIPTPSTKSQVELKILKNLVTPEEAEIACYLSGQPEPIEIISERVGIQEDELRPQLELMVTKGAVFKVYLEEPLYSLACMMPGIYEFQVDRLSPEMVTLFEKYYAEKHGEAVFSNKTPFPRVVPVQQSISAQMNVYTYEEVENLIDGAATVTLANCLCRSNKKLIGEGCDAPVDDICILLDSWGDYYAENGLGHRVSKEEGKNALKRAEEAGLVHNSLNVQEGSLFICNCCGCCCALLRGITELEIPTAVAKSNFIAEVSEEDCTECGECEERCQINAIEFNDSVASIITDRCIGCGICVSGCPMDAISMKKREEEITPPENINELMMNIAKGRT